MSIRVEAGWFFNLGTGQICGISSTTRKPLCPEISLKTVIIKEDKTAIRYQIGPKTKISKEGWVNWWDGKPLAITYPDVILRPDTANPPVVEAIEIKAAPEGMEPGQIPEMPKYLERLR